VGAVGIRQTRPVRRPAIARRATAGGAEESLSPRRFGTLLRPYGAKRIRNIRFLSTGSASGRSAAAPLHPWLQSVAPLGRLKRVPRTVISVAPCGAQGKRKKRGFAISAYPLECGMRSEKVCGIQYTVPGIPPEFPLRHYVRISVSCSRNSHTPNARIICEHQRRSSAS